MSTLKHKRSRVRRIYFKWIIILFHRDFGIIESVHCSVNLESDEKLVFRGEIFSWWRAMNQSEGSLLQLITLDQTSEAQNKTLQILNNSINWRDLLSTQLFQVKSVLENIHCFHQERLKTLLLSVSIRYPVSVLSNTIIHQSVNFHFLSIIYMGWLSGIRWPYKWQNQKK